MKNVFEEQAPCLPGVTTTIKQIVVVCSNILKQYLTSNVCINQIDKTSNIINNSRKSLNVVAEWNKYYFDFKTYKI